MKPGPRRNAGAGAEAGKSNLVVATSAASPLNPDPLTIHLEEPYMGAKTRETFAKRQKERARQEKQRDKLAKRQQRKSERPEGSAEPDNIDWTTSADDAAGDDSPGDDT